MAIVVPPNSLKLLPQRLSASEKSAVASPNYILKLHHPILSLLERCVSMRQLRQLHAHMITTGLVLDTFAASRLLAFAALSLDGDLHYALAVFRCIPSPNLFIWNAMIRAFSRSNQPQFSLRFYIQMLHEGILPNSYTFPFLLKSCAHLRAFSEGQQIHGHVLKAGFWGNPFISNSLIHMYSEFGRFELAEILFHVMGESDACEVSWAAMIAGFIDNGRPNDAVALFCSKDWKMMNLDQITLTTVLSACAHLQDLKLGIDIHNYIVDNGIELNLILCNSLLNMYVKCGQIGIAEKLFDGMYDKDSISWNILILGLLENGNFAEGFSLFSEMKSRNIRVNESTMLILLSSCGELEWVAKIHQDLIDMSFESSIPVYNALIDAYTRNGSVDLGRKIFDEMPNRDIISWNSIIAGYARCGFMNLASQLFDQMPMKDNFSWSTMILGYIRCEQPEQAFDFYKELVNEGITKPDKVTLLGALSACSQLGALEEGKAIHLYIKNNDILIDAALGTALLDMYTKCGCLSEGVSVFEAMTERDTFVWTAMISGLAIHGYGKEALEVFGRMKAARGDSAEPNSITFLNVLSACSHAGLVEEGWRIYQSVSEYGIAPDRAHSSCMVDLLGRAGHLKEAADLVTNLGAEAGTKVWGALLGACRIHGNLELGKVAYKRILELDPLHEGAHVLMSNIYAEAGEWNESKNIRRKMKDRNISKEVGRSWIEVDGMINVFTAGCGS